MITFVNFNSAFYRRGRKRPSTDVCPEPSKKRERDVSPSILDDDYELPSPTGSISLLADQVSFTNKLNIYQQIKL